NGQDQPFLVLVIRAQLIQKYPNVIVYAQTVEPGTPEPTLTGEQIHPIFDGLLAPDVAFYGFELTADMLRDNPNLYFVLQEQPGEPKFADEMTNAGGGTAKHTSSASLSVFGSSAGVVAQETFLLPFRLGIQGSALLPPEP